MAATATRRWPRCSNGRTCSPSSRSSRHPSSNAAADRIRRAPAMSDIIPPPETVTDEFGNTTDDQFNEDQDELQKAFAAETGLSQSDIQTINAAETALGPLDLTTLVTLAQMDALDSIETYYNPIAETFSDDDSSYDEQKSVTEDQKDKVAQQERSVRGKMARRIVLFLLGI